MPRVAHPYLPLRVRELINRDLNVNIRPAALEAASAFACGIVGLSAQDVFAGFTECGGGG
jgi:hypothetical protein